MSDFFYELDVFDFFDFFGGYHFRISEDTNIALFITLIGAFLISILLMIFVTPPSKRDKLPGFLKFLSDVFNFRWLIIEKILKATYIISTIFLFFAGIVMGITESIEYLLISLLGPLAIRLVYEAAMMVILMIKNLIEINNKLKYDDSRMKGKKNKQDPREKQDIFDAPIMGDASNKNEDSVIAQTSAVTGAAVIATPVTKVAPTPVPQAAPIPQVASVPQMAPVPQVAPAPKMMYCRNCGSRFDVNALSNCPNCNLKFNQ